MFTKRKEVNQLMDTARIGRLAEIRVCSGAPLPGDGRLVQAGVAAEVGLNSLGMTSRSRTGDVLDRPRRIA